jgi:hypothetical protein
MRALWLIGYPLFALSLLDLVVFYGLAISSPDTFRWPWFVPTPSMSALVILAWALILYVTSQRRLPKR